MKALLRRLLVTVSVGGGFAGAILTVDRFHDLKTSLQVVAALTFFILRSFVAATSLLFVKSPNSTGLVLAALALQIP